MNKKDTEEEIREYCLHVDVVQRLLVGSLHFLRTFLLGFSAGLPSITNRELDP